MGRQFLRFPVAFLCALLLAASAVAQQPPKPRPQPPIKAYKPVATTLPVTINDPTFDSFRRQLGEAAVRKDVAALKRFVVAQGFFWKGEKGERADRTKSGYDNLAAALQLNAPDGAGWEQLASYAFDPTAAAIPTIKDVVCSPADPAFNEQDFESLLKATQTELEDWGYPLLEGIEVRATRKPNAPVTEKLGLNFVRVVIDEEAANQPPSQLPMLKIVTPAGKIGYILAFSIAPIGNDQLCYSKDAEGWKISGFIGGEP